MATFTFKMPDIGEGIVEAEIVEWHVNVGDLVVEDAPLADVMTDKATVEITSPVSGTVTGIGCATGEKIGIGADFVIFSTEATSVEDSIEVVPVEKPRMRITPDVVKVERQPAKNDDRQFVDEPVTDSAQVSAATQTSQQLDSQNGVLASPAVRRRARERGISLVSVSGSGPGGRVLQEDLVALDSVSPAAADITATDGPHAAVTTVDDNTRAQPVGPQVIPITGLRRTIAERLVASKRSIPHFTYVEEVDVTELESLRHHLNNAGENEHPRLSLLHFILLGVCRSVVHWPQCNAHYDDGENVLTQYPSVHLGVATMTDAGLVVPVIRDAQSLTIWELSERVKQLAAGARAKSLTPDQLSGSTITVTSLGALAGIASTPIINRPETAIIGPNRMMDKLEQRNGHIVSRKAMNLSSSFDHRIVDGQDAAKLIQHLKSLLEHPATLFM